MMLVKCYLKSILRFLRFTPESDFRPPVEKDFYAAACTHHSHSFHIQTALIVCLRVSYNQIRVVTFYKLGYSMQMLINFIVTIKISKFSKRAVGICFTSYLSFSQS